MAARKGGLGKGLDSLIPGGKETATVEKKENVKVKEVIKEVVKEVEVVKNEMLVKINEVEPNREQPRKDFNEDALVELSDSIKQYGIIQPLIVKDRQGYYEIVAGERRWRAAKMAGLKEVPVIVKDYTEQEIAEIALIENLQREDLNPIEEALAYQRLITEFHMKQDELAEKISKSRVAVTNALRLLKLSEKVQQMLIDDMISSGHARALIGIEDEEQQYTIATKIFDEKLSVRETEKLVKNLGKEKKEKSAVVLEDTAIYEDLEEKMKSIMGTKVVINRKTNTKGKIEIDYYSIDELDRLMDLFRQIK
ncbi:MAG: ParB/RepB/Spo0J family partition protein [Lachnospiraceae bacterium]|nr:ParB/RepB/Spo0J family partition protein [Lachnospiraceae bacterium]